MNVNWSMMPSMFSVLVLVVVVGSARYLNSKLTGWRRRRWMRRLLLVWPRLNSGLELTGEERSGVEALIDRGSKLQAIDAAYVFWKSKDRLTQRRPEPSGPKLDLTDEIVLGRLYRDAVAHISNERATAHQGITLLLLKVAHPNKRLRSLQKMIKTAVKFDTDCAASFRYLDGGLSLSSRTAVKLASEINPRFSEITYQSAVSDLCFSMR